VQHLRIDATINWWIWQSCVAWVLIVFLQSVVSISMHQSSNWRWCEQHRFPVKLYWFPSPTEAQRISQRPRNRWTTRFHFIGSGTSIGWRQLCSYNFQHKLEARLRNSISVPGIFQQNAHMSRKWKELHKTVCFWFQKKGNILLKVSRDFL